ARAVVLALAGAGALEIVIVNRTETRANDVAALAPGVARSGALEDADGAELVVNATPQGMGENRQVPAEHLGSGQLVVDLVYHPAVTPLVEAARSKGAAVANGLGMLIHQAAHA